MIRDNRIVAVSDRAEIPAGARIELVDVSAFKGIKSPSAARRATEFSSIVTERPSGVSRYRKHARNCEKKTSALPDSRSRKQ